jgi:hypothetical protein
MKRHNAQLTHSARADGDGAMTSPFDTKHLPQMQETFGKQWVPHAGRPKKARDTLTPKLRAAERLLRNHGYEVRKPGE